MRTTTTITSALVLAATSIGAQAPAAAPEPKSPIVLIVGCAQPGPSPQVWRLTRVGERTVTPQPSISTEEGTSSGARPLGRDTYELVGIADWVAPDASLRIGDRGDILTPERVNTTGALRDGHKVAVKGLYVAGRPARINVTSVIDLAPTCP